MPNVTVGFETEGELISHYKSPLVTEQVEAGANGIRIITSSSSAVSGEYYGKVICLTSTGRIDFTDAVTGEVHSNVDLTSKAFFSALMKDVNVDSGEFVFNIVGKVG